MKQIYYVRHGLSEMNVAGVAAGHTNTPLTQTGIEQAIAAGKMAKDQGLSFDLIVSSPLDRAHHTAKHIASEIEYPIEEILLVGDLIERYFGELEGKSIETHYGISMESYMQDPFSIDHIPNVEKISDIEFRARKALQELMNRPEESILIVSHGSIGRSFQRAAVNAPITEVLPQIKNAEIFRLV